MDSDDIKEKLMELEIQEHGCARGISGLNGINYKGLVRSQQSCRPVL
jgi:hypothetical protein